MGREVGFPGSDARELKTGPAARSGHAPAVALVTCAELPEGDEDAPALVEALARLGIGATPAVWDDPRIDWSRFDLVLPRSAWDYAERRDDFLAWAARVPRVLNPLRVLEWNTDKQRYLTDLAEAGVPVVPTTFVAPGEPFAQPDAPFVVKPSISAGGRSSARFDPGDARAAAALVEQIHAESRTAMVQPLLDDAAETALVYLGGRYSHALARRVPLPRGGALQGLYLDEELEPARASAAQRRVAGQALAVAPADLLYARVDLMGGVVLELEVAEPSLYLALGAGAPDRFASCIAALL